MKKAASGLVAAAVAMVVAGAAHAQSNSGYQFQYQNPSYQTPQSVVPAQQGTYAPQQGGSVTYGTIPYTGTTTYGTSAQPSYGSTTTQPSYGGTATQPTYGTSTTTTTTGTTTYQAPQSTGTVYQQPGFPSPQPYFPTQPSFPTQPGFPTTIFPAPNPAPSNPQPLPGRGEVPDTDAWTFSMPRYYPAIRACLRNANVKNPVIANIQERRNRTIMLIGQGGTSEYSVCRTGLDGTRVRPGKKERGLPPAFYAPLGSAFTITPDRPFQPVVDTSQRLLGWVVRTTPVRLDAYGGGRTFDGQFIRPVTVNSQAQ